MKDIIETGITIDHETGDVYVDMRSRRFASMCRRAGLKDTTKSNSAPYQRFRGDLDLLDIIIRKKRSSAVSQTSLDALKRSRKDRSDSANTTEFSTDMSGTCPS